MKPSNTSRFDGLHCVFLVAFFVEVTFDVLIKKGSDVRAAKSVCSSLDSVINKKNK